MKTIIAAFLISLTTSCFALNASAGYDVREIAAAMRHGKYKVADLDMSSKDPKYELKIWAVDKGFIIAKYLKSSKKVESLSFFVCDERAKAQRKSFSFGVKKFNTKTGELTLQLPPVWERK